MNKPDFKILFVCMGNICRSPTAEAVFRKMAADGKLVMAGPFLDNGELRGIFIFDVATLEEAKALTEADPAVKAGKLIMELHPWMSQRGTTLP